MTETTHTSSDPIADAIDAGLEETNLRATPLPATSVDAAGTERIVAYPRPWTPAPVEPDPKQVERLAAFERVREHQAEQRQELLRSGTVDGTTTGGTEKVPGAADPATEPSHPQTPAAPVGSSGSTTATPPASQTYTPPSSTGGTPSTPATPGGQQGGNA